MRSLLLSLRQGLTITPTFTANCMVGSYTVTATVTGVATGAIFNLTNVVGLPATVAQTSGGGQSTFVNTVFPNPLVAIVRDACKTLFPAGAYRSPRRL